jgi:hypothetical protein
LDMAWTHSKEWAWKLSIKRSIFNTKIMVNPPQEQNDRLVVLCSPSRTQFF